MANPGWARSRIAAAEPRLPGTLSTRERRRHDDDATPARCGLIDDAADRGDILGLVLVDLVEDQVRRQNAQGLYQEARPERACDTHDMVHGADNDR
jgi:hypothetical protein